MSSSIIFQAPPNKSGVVIDLYPFASDTALITGLAATEETNAKGFYTTTYTGSETDLHRIVARDSATNILANWYISLTNSDQVDIAQDTDPQMEIVKTQTQGLQDSTHLAFRHILIAGSIISGDYTDTRVIDVSQFTLNILPIVELPTSAGFGRYVNSIQIRASVTNASRACDILLFNYGTSVFDNIGSINQTTLTTQTIGVNIKYSDPATGDIRIKFDGSINMDVGDVLTLDFYEATSHSTFSELAKRIGDYDTNAGENVKQDFVGIPNSGANADAVWDELRAEHLIAGSFGQSVLAQVLSIEDNSITFDTIAPNAIASDQLDASAITEIKTGACDLALTDIHLDHLLETTTTGVLPGSVNSILGQMLERVTSWRFIAEALSEAPTGGAAVGDIADAVWDELRAGHLIAGSFGEGVIIQTNNDKTGYNVTSGQVDDVINPVTAGGGVVGTVTGNVDGSVGSVVNPVDIDMAQTLPITPTADTVGQALFNAERLIFDVISSFVVAHVEGIADNTITFDTIAPDAIASDQLAASAIAEIADGIWDELRAGHITVGTFGEGVNVQTNNDKTGYNVTSGQVDDVIQPVTAGGGVIGTVTGNVDGSVGSVVAKVDLNDNQQTVTIGGVFLGVDLIADQSSVTIGTVNNITNPVDIDMSQALPVTPTLDTVGQALFNAEKITFHLTTSFVVTQTQGMEDNIITFDTIAPNAIGSDQLDATAIAEIADGVWDELRAGHTTTGTFGEGTNMADVEWKRLWEQVTLAEGYASSGVIHSASQIIYLVMSILQNPQYVNFEFKARKLDGTTEAAAFQMDDDTNPTQHNRIR